MTSRYAESQCSLRSIDLSCCHAWLNIGAVTNAAAAAATAAATANKTVNAIFHVGACTAYLRFRIYYYYYVKLAETIDFRLNSFVRLAWLMTRDATHVNVKLCTESRVTQLNLTRRRFELSWVVSHYTLLPHFKLWLHMKWDYFEIILK